MCLIASPCLMWSISLCVVWCGDRFGSVFHDHLPAFGNKNVYFQASDKMKQQDTINKFKRLYDVRVPMRDGVTLSTDITMPKGEGPFPLVLVRTPYQKSMATFAGVNWAEWAEFYAENGYAFALQDSRGRGDSDGEYNYHFQEGADGHDAIEWLGEQPWCNGDVGTMGVSYLAMVQWFAAREQPSHLKCMVPTDAGPDPMGSGYTGGAFKSGRLPFFAAVTGRTMQESNTMGLDWKAIQKCRPLLEADSFTGKAPLKHYRDFISHSTYDDYWKAIDYQPEDFGKVNIPILQISTWFYESHYGVQYMWKGMHEHNGRNDDHYMLVGPWTHMQTLTGGGLSLNELSFSPESVLDPKAVHLNFFDRYLKKSADSFRGHKVQVYLTGKNEWRNYDSYPAPGTQATHFFLASDGPANTLNGGGQLVMEAQANQTPDHYVFDPDHPITYPGTELEDIGSDHRPYERRDDMLVYTSDVLDAPFEVLGNILVELYASSTALDTDFTATLTDVYPDGRSVIMGTPHRGILRARYRKGLEKEVLLTPGEVDKFVIDLGHIGHVFLPGHKIRVAISSSAAPYHSINPNTGNPIATDTADPVHAHQTIYHDVTHPSALILPCLPNDIQASEKNR